jgi:ligand-binding SRPBCC domain-containing protein
MESLILREQVVAASIDEVFAFYGDASNLEKLTPPWLQFNILTPMPVVMRPGVRIDYRIRIHGMPLRWQSEITRWNPPHGFTDEQRRGPYRYWIHNHEFEPHPQGTLVRDRICYAAPGGKWIDRLFVRKDVDRIFDYRVKKLDELFGAVPAG